MKLNWIQIQKFAGNDWLLYAHLTHGNKPQNIYGKVLPSGLAVDSRIAFPTQKQDEPKQVLGQCAWMEQAVLKAVD